MTEVFQDYEALERLLREQRDLLKSGKSHEAWQLLSPIGECSRRISKHGSRLQDGTPEESRRLKTILAVLEEELSSTRDEWMEHRHRLEEKQSQLRAARRFTQEVRPKAGMRPIRFNVSG